MDMLLAIEPLEILTPRILVCDDNDTGRALMKRMLRARGYLVEEASEGRSAIAAIERSPPDLLLLDLRLPDIDGSEVLRQLRCDHDVKALPIIMVSAEHDGEIVAGCLALGASDYITKPIHAGILCARVATHLDLHFSHACPPAAVTRPRPRLVSVRHRN
ncbi:MAG TPA: response regulator [Verrucomicrobiae bacterium]|jgi:DNA-binding response OmpR family regulator|nr:response regulator [Verrucomicrobiae bacterium]